MDLKEFKKVTSKFFDNPSNHKEETEPPPNALITCLSAKVSTGNQSATIKITNPSDKQWNALFEPEKDFADVEIIVGVKTGYQAIKQLAKKISS